MKGHTKALPANIRQARQRKKAVAQLKDLIVCREYYYDNRADYTNSELNMLDNTVMNQQVNLDLI